MNGNSDQVKVAETLQLINRTWLEGRPHDLAPMLHPSIVMALPRFAGRITGSDSFIGGFVDFASNADLLEYGESDHQVDVAGDTAVASFAFDMVYKRSGASYRCTGRDLWVFSLHEGTWLAVWRSMLDLIEAPA
jgi:hypothetical protein